jgi:hypothetical protein
MKSSNRKKEGLTSSTISTNKLSENEKNLINGIEDSE